MARAFFALTPVMKTLRTALFWLLMMVSLLLLWEVVKAHWYADQAVHPTTVPIILSCRNQALSLFNREENVFPDGRKVKFRCFNR